VKEKHLIIRLRQCLLLAEATSCPRGKVGALLLDPVRNVVLADGYNGGPRDGGDLCGGHTCTRNDKGIKSGHNIEVGCHHAEMNVICNAAANGIKTDGAWLIVNCLPCLMCAKLIHHAGIKKVITIANTYSINDGIKYLNKHGIVTEIVGEKYVG